MATRKEIAQNQKILYDDAVANNMFQAAVPTFKEFQKRLEGQGYQKMVYDNYKKHNVRGKGFNNLNEFRGAFGGSFYADENKIGVSNRTAAILSSANNAVRQAKRNIQTKLGQAKKFNGGRVSPRLKNPLQNQNVQKNEFNYNSTTGKTGTYTTTDGVEFDNEYDASQYQNKLDKYGEEWNNAVDMGVVPSELDMADPDLSDTDVAMRQMERRQEWLNENQDRRSKELNESMHLQGSPFVASGGAVAPSSFNTAISNEANRLSDVEYGAYNTAKAYNQMLRTTLLQELKEQKQRNENAGWLKDKWNDVSNYFGAMFNTMLDPKLYSQGVMDAAIANNLLQVKKGMEDGTIKKGSNAGNAAQAMLGAIQQQQGEAAKQQQYGTKAYLYGDMSGRSLKFMGDFALSGWRNVMTTGFTKAGEKVGEKMALGALGKWFTKNTGRVLGDMAGSAALAATNQLGSTYNNVIERYVGMNNENGGVTQDKNGDLKFNEGVSLGKAIKDGFGSATIENFSEMFGEYLPGAPKLLSKLGLSKVSAFFEKIGNNAYYKWLSNATNKSGIQGVMAEISEEEFGTALHAAWGDGDGSWSDFNVFTNPDAREKQIDTCLGMFYSVGFMQAPRTAVGAINAVQYFNIKHQVAKADKFGQVMFNDKWDEVKSKIDVTTNADLTKTVLEATRSDSMTAKQKGAVINYAMFLSKLRGFNQASDAKTKDKVEEGETTPTLSNDLDDAYTEGHNADDADKHNIQLEQNDKANELAAMLHITPEQLHDMADEDLEAMTGQDDKLDKAIYDYQVSTAKYQGVMDGAQDEVDMAAHQAAMETDNMTDLSRGTVRKATIKATGGLEDYEVYIISGNIATHDDGSIDVGNSDDMIIYYDPTTGRKEHADAMMFADLIEELPAADVKAQAVADAKEKAIKEVAGIVDGTIDVGSQFKVTGADGLEHTYEILADYGDGTAAISIDGNVVENPYSLEDLQQLKDLEDQKRLEAAKAQREKMEKERADQTQETEQTEEIQPSLDFNQILNDDGNVVLVDVLDKDGNTKYPDSKLFLIRDTGAKAKVVEMKSDGTFVPHAVSKKNVATISSMSLDEYKQAMAETSMIEENSGAIEGDRGGIEVNDELPPVPDNVTINGDGTYSVDGAVQGGENTTAPAEQTEQTPAMTLEDGTIVPMLEDGNPDFSKLTADQTAELYDSQFGEDADSVISGWVSDAKKALDKANNMTVKGKNFVEQKAAKEAKEKAIADAQTAYDSAVAIRDAYNERQLAKVEDTADGRKNLIEKARRKFARLKSAVKDDAEAVSQLYKDVVGSLLHRLYDGTGIDVTDTIPLTAEEYVASNLGAHSLNYEGTETSKGVKQETGLSREDFAKTQLLAADGKGTTIDDLVHSLWENRPSNLESLDTQDIRNALIGVLNSGFRASEARNYIENLRIAQAENILEEQKKAADNAAFAEENKAESEQQTETAPESEEKTGEDNSDEINDEENEKINEQTNENINAPEVPEDATDENPLGEQRPEEDLPFSARDNGTQQTTSERAADVEKNKVDDMKVVDNIVGQKTRKAFERLAKMMGANIQWQYSDKLGNGWIQETTDADGNVHRTIFITLDSSITEGAQFIFGHEMTHQIKSLNPAAYNELTRIVIDTYGADAYDKEIDETMKRYSDAGFSGRARDYYAEEVVADAVGEMIRDLNLAHTLAMKMSHPLLAAIHEILQKIKMAFFGTEYSDVTKNIIRSIEQAYVKTAKGEVTNSETGEDVSFSLRQKPEPKKKGIGYKVFVLKEGKLYPPMVANPDGAATPVGVWLDADAAPIAGESKTGRPQVKQGGKGTQGGSGKLAYRPGWHLGVVPYAIQFNRKDAEGNKTLFPKNFVFAEVEYAADVDYQEEARQEGINPSGKYQHSLAGLKHLPTDGYYMYRTNPNPETDPWVITGAMKVNRILTRAEQAELVKNAGREPQQIQEGDIVTDDVVNSINQEIADAPKFSLKVYHGSGADFTEFDFDHMGEGAGSQTFGWGGYVTSSKKIGKSYANLVDANAPYQDVEYVGNNAHEYTDVVAGLFNGGQRDYDDVKEFLQNGYNTDKENARKKQMLEWFESTKPSDWKSVNDGKRNLYEVNIPEDNGSNYLDFENPMNEEQINTIRDALVKNGVDVSSWENRGFKLDLPFKDVYAAVLPMIMRCEPKEVSKFLSSLGFTGIKYPAGTIMGGAEEGDTNYVIFKPEDMKITEHTKFSIKTYHGSQASFDKFDHSFMGSGEGAQAYGWGTYVSEVEGIAKAYAKQNAAKHGMPREYKIAQTRLNHAKFEYDKVQRRYDNSKAYIDSLKEDLQNYRESMARRKEKVAYFAQNNMPETVDKLLKQIKRAEDTIKVTENDINMRTNDLEGWKPKLEEVKKKYEEEQKKFDAIPKPQIERNLYSVDIPDDTGENYLGWDEKMTHRMRDIRKEILEDNGYKLVDSDDMRDYFEDRDGKEYELFKEQYKTGGTFYEELAQLLHSQKLASLALKEYGFDGVKVIADRNTGGNKEGKMNYVIFDENNAQITNHTKFSLRLKSAIEDTETNPSDAQKESGNYKKGHIKFGGYDYTIENPKGSTRSGKDANGKEWKVTMHDTYGYIRGKFGKDGDHLDMFINDKADLDNWDGDVFVVDQVNPDGSFDEHKVMYGYDSMDDAKKAYLANYSDGWQGLENITGVSKDEFDKWLDTSKRKLKPFADYAKVKFSLKDNQGNPLNQDGTLKLDKIKSVDELTDEDFTSAFRNVELPAIPKNMDAAIGANGKPVVIKKNIFEKNWNAHKFTPAESKKVLNDALYNTDLVGHTQPTKKPNHWVAIKLDDKSPITVLEVNDNKDNVEVVGWYTLDERNLGRIKRQAERNGGELIMLTPKDDKVESLSTPPLSSAAKIDNSSETAKENGEKFSLKDEKTMFGMHNISIDKLRKAIKQGGFAAPSMGVVDSKNGIYSDYGEITLIPKAEKLVKRTGKNAGTFTADAWTPTYPQVEKIMTKQGEKAFNADMNKLYKNVDVSIWSNIKDSWKPYLLNGDVRDGLYFQFLQEKGMKPEVVRQKGKYDKSVWEKIESIVGADGVNKTELSDTEVSELLKLMNEVTGEDNSVEGQRKALEAEKKDAEKQGNALLIGLLNRRIARLDGVEDYWIADGFMREVAKDISRNGKVKLLDSISAARQKVVEDDKLTAEFNSWLDKKSGQYEAEEMLYNGTTPTGKPKYIPNTIENAVKLMKKQGLAGGYNAFHPGVGAFIAKLSPQVNTLAAMKKAKDKLIPFGDERHNEVRDKILKEHRELARDLQIGESAWDDSGEDRMQELAEVKPNDLKGYIKRNWKKDVSNDWVERYNDLVNTIKNDYPVYYFETKFMRPYGLDEFEKAIVPNDTPSDVVDALKKAGIDVSSYERGNAEDRQKVTMDAINSSDNIRFSLKEEKEKIIADAKANGTYMTAPNGEKTKLDAEQWATVRTTNFKNWFGDWENDPENASKVVDENGEPMVVWHGRSAEFNTFEKKEGVRFIMGLEDKVKSEGFFFSPDKGLAEEFASNSSRHRGGKANVVPCFLNIRRPMDLTGEDFDRIYEDVTGWEYMVGMDTQDNLWGIMDEEGMADKIKEKGYDGAIFVEEVDDSYEPTKISYCALDANQIKSAENNNGDFSADNNDIRFSLAGERGAAAADKAEERTARMDNLSVARKMEEKKKDAKAIKMATGWERGADGKWRYEMPDAKIKDTMDVGGGHIVKRYEDDMLWNGGKLSDVIDAPELFKAYPHLKDVRIETDAIMNDMPSNGEYNAKTNTITIHADELKYMNSILNHEIQHAIQSIEGFDRGGSPRLVRGEIKKRLAEVTKQIRQLRAEGKEDEAKAIVEKNRGLYNAYQANDDYNSYKSLAGEVEARNVQERMNMTPEERRKTLAESTEDVARKDQIFLGVGDVSFSLRDMADGKESGAADMAEDLKSLNTPDEVDDAIKTAIDDMPIGWRMANRKIIHIAQALGENRKAEIAGDEPKFSLKDGTLIKAGTYFSGGGLVEEGLKGIIDPVVAVEYDEKISGVYRNNFGQHIVTADVRDVDPKELVKQIDGEVEYFHASPVCKNYSQAKSNHAEVELDKETAASTAEFINAVKPKVVTIENVKGYKDSEAMKIITDALDANGYTWDADVYNAADYGGYTNRERLIVRAVRDGKLPEKPKKMAHKSGWYEAVEDIIPTLTEKKNGVAPWMDIRLKADGIDWRNIDKPLYVMGSAYADGKIPHAFADELLPTLRTKSGDVIVMPDGKVYRAMGRVLARVSGVSDDYKMPFSENLSHTIIGNGIPTQLTEHVIAPLLTGSDPKFSIRTYHGTGAKFDKFDFSHMGEGEGSQAFGWGGYVTNSKDIAEDYTRRAKIRKDNGGFEFVTDMSANNKDMVRQYIYKHKDVNKGLDAMRKDLHSAIEMFPDDDDLRELSNILAKKNEEIVVPDNIAYLYDVDIPDDNGDYLDWDAPLTDKQKNTIIKELRRLKIDFADFKKRGFSFDGSFGGNAYDFLMYALRKTKKWKDVNASRAVSKFLSSIGFTGIKYKAGSIFGGAKEGDYNYVIFDENNANIVGNTRFSLRYDKFEHDLNQWKKDNNLPKDAQRPTIPQRNAGESAVDFLRRVDEYRKQMALWKTAPTYEQHLLSDDTALGEFNRELQRGSVLKRIAFQDSMLAIRKAQEAIMKEVGVDRLNMAEDAYTAENRSHGKGKNEFEEYNNEFLQPLRKAYHQMKKVLGDSYDNVRIYMMAKHGLERDAQVAFKKSLESDFDDVAKRSAAYRAYKGDMNRIINDSDLEYGRIDFKTWRNRDNLLRTKYSPSYMAYRYDENGIVFDYSGLSALFGGPDFEEAGHKLVRDIEDKYVTETHDLWDATNAATKKILRDGYKAGMMSKDTYQYVRDMYGHYIPLRGWDGTTADQVWDYVGGGKGSFNQTLKTAHGRTSIADDPIAYIENMAESGILLNNKNWVKQHLMLLAQNHPTSLLTLSKAWYVKSTDANGNEEWIPATPQITSQMNSNQVKATIDAFEKKMEQMAANGDATQKRDGLNIAYPQTHSEEREHEVRVMKDGEEYVIYVNGDPQLAQAMNNTRAHRVREIQSGKLDRAAAWLGRKMAAAYTSLSPLFIPSNYFRDLTMTLASTAIREDAKYNYLLRKNLATSWNLGFMLRDYQNGKLRDKVNNGNATPKEQMFYDFMMNGGETGFVSSLDVEDLKKKFKNDLKDLDRWKTNPVKVGHTIMDGIEFLNRMIEDSNRFAVYMTSIQYGRSIDEAVNDAKDVTLNFNRKGTGEYGWQMIRNLYLFINPAVQSLQTLGALVKHHPFKFTAVTASWLASGVLVPIVNAALMNLLGGDDDKDKYWQFTKWDRRNNLIMWVPFTHEYVKIPLAQEFRAFYGIGDMIASKMMGGELAEETWSQYAEDLLGQVVDMLPLDPTGYDGNIAVSLMPNPIRPVFELAFNVDFTGKPLFKETEYNKYDPNFTKAYVGTPDWLVRVSKMVNSIGNDYPDVQQNAIDAFGDPRYNLNNPAVVDHVLSSYLGGAYTMGSQVLGVLTKSLNDPKEIKMADIPLVSKFVSNPDDRPVTKKQGDEFWNMKENHDRAANTLSKLKKQAKVDGDYSMLERFYGSEEYKQYKQEDVKVKKYEEDKKKERAEESGEEYRPHKLNADDIYKAHATPKDDFEDLKLKQLFTKLNGFKTSYDLLVDTAPGQSDGYYNTNKVAIDAIDEISLDKQEISELKKGFLEDGKDAYNAEDMKRIRELRKRILSVLETANKVVVANQKAKAEKK